MEVRFFMVASAGPSQVGLQAREGEEIALNEGRSSRRGGGRGEKVGELYIYDGVKVSTSDKR